MARLINATLGAHFGSVASPIDDQLIEGLKFCLRCPKECQALGEALERIQPLVKYISTHYRHDADMANWPNEIGKCVEDARVVLRKCESNRINRLLWWKMAWYGQAVLKLRDRINELIRMATLVLLAPKGSRCGIMQDVPEKIFGMEEYFMRVKSAIFEGHRWEDSSCVGIRGMGGSGKTLLAKMVNNDYEIQEVFGKDSVIWITVGRDANVSEIYKHMRDCLKGCCDGGSLEEQRTDLINAFASAQALLILDDVWDDCVRESKEMVYWLNIAKGSKCVTLITTQDKLVTCQCVNAGEEIILRLLKEQSWQLFCTHAFDSDTPILNADVEDMARAVCEECDCLPLALRVIGCAMNGKSDWERMLRHMQASTTLNQSIEQQLYARLQISYDTLDGPRKVCFLYFAAYPKDYEVKVKELFEIWVVEGVFGEELSKEEAMEEAQFALEVLVQRSLIEVSKVDGEGALDQVKMPKILRNLATRLVNKGDECDRECLFKMEKKGFVEFPRSWLGCEMKVRRLSLWGGTIQHFSEEVLAPNLKICMLHGDLSAEVHGLNLCESNLDDWSIGEKFFRKLHALKLLQIHGYRNIRQLPESMGGLRSLQHLDLFRCWALMELPESMGQLDSLQHLNLSRCSALEELPESMGGLGSLQHLNLSGCSALELLPDSMGGLGSLQHLNLSGCWALKQLRESMGGLGSLQHLNLSGCWALKRLPESMGGLGFLEHLNLSGCSALEELPESMGGLGSLQHLNLSGCWALKQLRESMGGLGSLQHLNLSGCWALEELPESMGGLGFLEHLNLSRCSALEELPESMGGLGSLQHLNLSGCLALELLPDSMGGLGSLQHLNLSGCWALKQLPKSMGRLGSLQHLNLSGCWALKQLQESMGGLGSLQHLNLSGCWALKRLPESMGGLGFLEHLNLSRCSALEELLESMGGLGSLQHLNLSGCSALEELPDSMGGLGSLQHLNLSGCWALKQLPESMGRLGSLLHLSRTNVKRIILLTSHESREPLNLSQCRSLSSKLQRTLESIERLIFYCYGDKSFLNAALENFYLVCDRAKELVESCSSVHWCQASVFQIRNEEAFKEILLETCLCYSAIFELVASKFGGYHEDLRSSSTFEPPSSAETMQDQVALMERFRAFVDDGEPFNRNQHLAKYLLEKLLCFSAKDFDVCTLSMCPDDQLGRQNEGLLGNNVTKQRLLDVPCAVKEFVNDEYVDGANALIFEEARILARLNHPNIVKFICCGHDNKSSRDFIAMEWMERSLHDFIKLRRKKCGIGSASPFPLLSAMDIMLQIAYGTCYLHEMGVAHRDIKSSNVVVSQITTRHLEDYLQVKLVDFGLSKSRLRASMSNTISHPKTGTPVYMAPEAFDKGRANWFMADVYSFGVLCSVILSGNEPFPLKEMPRPKLYEEVRSGRRPKIPSETPPELSSLINECWNGDRNARPDFHGICTRLATLRHKQLRGGDSHDDSFQPPAYIQEMFMKRSDARLSTYRLPQNPGHLEESSLQN